VASFIVVFAEYYDLDGMMEYLRSKHRRASSLQPTKPSLPHDEQPLVESVAPSHEMNEVAGVICEDTIKFIHDAALTIEDGLSAVPVTKSGPG
jgi:hypothetical protein